MTRETQATRMNADVFMLMHVIKECLKDSSSSIEARNDVALQSESL